MKEKILKQFDESNSLYYGFGERCKGIIRELIVDNSISSHQITSRIKNRDSLSKKIDSKKDKYSDLSDITDICGIRIITYLESDVNRIAEILEKEFQVDPINSVDKRKLKTDQFGYKSLHYVVSLNKQRLAVSENKKFDGLKLEIQIRSILQHAWAEIEHDLGYKGEIAIPESFKRSFNRLAALLETADIEFDRLKLDLSKYEIKVTEDIKTQPDEVLIDQASITSFVKQNSIFDRARQIISKNSNCIFYEKADYTAELERFVLFDVKTIGELERLISLNEKHFLAFVDLFSKDIKEEKLNDSLPLFYFLHFLASREESEEFVNKYFNYGRVKLSGKAGAKYFISVYRNSK